MVNDAVAIEIGVQKINKMYPCYPHGDGFNVGMRSSRFT